MAVKTRFGREKACIWPWKNAEWPWKNVKNVKLETKTRMAVKYFFCGRERNVRISCDQMVPQVRLRLQVGLPEAQMHRPPDALVC